MSCYSIWSKYYSTLVSVDWGYAAFSFFPYLCVWARVGARARLFVFIVSSALIGKGHLSNHEIRNQVIHEQNGAWASHDEWMNSLFHRMFQLLRTINTSWGRLYVLAATYDFPLSRKARFYHSWCTWDEASVCVCGENTRPMCGLYHSTRPS